MTARLLAALACVAACVLGSAILLAQDGMRATTQDGRKVILKPDGTWSYEGGDSALTRAVPQRAPAGATATETFSRGNFRLRYNDRKWVMQKEPDGTKWRLVLKGEDAQAIVIPEGFSATTNAMKQIALDNLHKAASESKIVKEEIRKVNGRDVLYMQIDASLKEIFFSYYYYIYGDKQGVIQVIAFTTPAKQAVYEADIFDLLNGLEVIR